MRRLFSERFRISEILPPYLSEFLMVKFSTDLKKISVMYILRFCYSRFIKVNTIKIFRKIYIVYENPKRN